MSVTQSAPINNVINRHRIEDQAFHSWYKFAVLGFPPHLVRELLYRLNVSVGDAVLDPFLGAGTTAVESKLKGLNAIGIEANPISHIVSAAKTKWRTDPDELMTMAQSIYDAILESTQDESNLLTLTSDQERLMIKGAMHPAMIHQCLTIKQFIGRCHGYGKFYIHLVTALAHTINFYAANVRFRPEITVAEIPEADILSRDCYRYWLTRVQLMVIDLKMRRGLGNPKSYIYLGDSRKPISHPPLKCQALITSPPYPCEKDYSRNSRLDSVILDIYRDRRELQSVKKTLLRSNSKGIYKADNDGAYVAAVESVQAICAQIDAIRRDKELSRDKPVSGFEKLYSRVIAEYFGGMMRHFYAVENALAPGAKMAYVVGDQQSYYQVNVSTAAILGELAERTGLYRVEEIMTFRNRAATASKKAIAENILILQKK